MGISLKKPADVPGSAVPAIVIGVFVSFGGVLFGYDTGTIGGECMRSFSYMINNINMLRRYSGYALLAKAVLDWLHQQR